MFKWAVSQDLVETNPSAGLMAYHSTDLKTRVLSSDEIGCLWKWLESGACPRIYADILKLQLLTGARCGEVSGITLDEIDFGLSTWTLPAGRSKNKKPRVTPLVGLAQEIIWKAVPVETSGALFTARTGTTLTSSHIGTYLIARRHQLPVDKFTTHDLRRTVVTMLAEMGVSLDVVAAVVGHEAGGRETRTLVRHYVRTDLIQRKREVLLGTMPLTIPTTIAPATTIATTTGVDTGAGRPVGELQ